jgi:hypothetical protein
MTTHAAWHLAQINVARLRAPIDDPLIADFKTNLDRINGLGDSSPGFVWRLQTEDGDATDFHPIDNDELIIVNLTVWESIEALADFVFRSDHRDFLRRRREWFERYGTAYLAMWWVPAGHIPTLDEAIDRLDRIERDGPTGDAFTFARRFAPPGSATELVADARDACPA